MNIEGATNLITRYKLTKTEPYTDPAYLIAVGMVKGMDFLKAHDWVQDLFREQVFSNYQGTWDDVKHTLQIYKGASE